MPDLAQLTKVFLVTLLLGLASGSLYAQDEAAGADSEAFPADQIEQMVAPIALYPDALIAQIMMASTYPLDVVQANRWLAEHEDLKDDALQQAVDQESWDDSVKALVFFPSVLGFMSNNLDWTQDLGDAVLAQQGDVTDAIQRLRNEAEGAGTLTSSDQQRVEKSGDTIIIQPAQPEVVYVPTYDPVKVYGESSPPATAYYPDAYADAATSYSTMESAVGTYPATTTVPAGTTAVYPTTEVDSSSDSLINFGLGAVAGGLLTAAIMWDDDDRYDRLYYGGRGYYGAPSYWGQPNYWNNNGWREPRNINVDRDVTRNVERGDVTINRGIVGNEIDRNEVRKWEHNPERRGGVRYRDASTENRFAAKRKDATINRDEARGRARDGDRDLKAPDLGQVRREGAASGGISKLTDNRGDGAGRAGDLKDRRPDAAGGSNLKDRQGAGRVADRAAQRPAGGDARAKVQAKAPERKAAAGKVKAKPRAQATAATKRPVNREAKRPSAPAKRPAAASAKPKARPASRASAPKASAFKANKPKATRAASNRGGASRAKAQRGGGGGGGRGGGGRRRG